MNPVYRLWWQFLMELRPGVRFFAERFPRVAPWAVRFRSLAHWVVGNPVQALAVLVGFLVWVRAGVPFLNAAGFVVCINISMGIFHRVGVDSGSRWVGWCEAWRLRRQWPSVWAAVAAKTSRVQAEVGTSKEPIASAVLRPVADHPKMSWLPRIDWPVVSWWVGPPPGRSLAALDELAVILAANLPRVADVSVEYERENDSHGRLIVSFNNSFAKASAPPWPEEATDEPINDLDAAIVAFERKQPSRPNLRVVDGDVS